MSNIISFKVGDYFTGILLETFKEKSGISRPRVRPINIFTPDIRVEFPRKLREIHPLGTRFLANVKVSQKTNKSTGEAVGSLYLVATDKTIMLQKNYSPTKEIYAIPTKDRTYVYKDYENLDEIDFEENINQIQKIIRDKAYSASISEIEKVKTVNVKYKRNPQVRQWAKERAKGICEGCNNQAPFSTKNGDPYLEVHHIQGLADDGPDSPRNVAAICPNCHSRAEYSSDSKDFNFLLKNIIEEKENTFN